MTTAAARDIPGEDRDLVVAEALGQADRPGLVWTPAVGGGQDEAAPESGSEGFGTEEE